MLMYYSMNEISFKSMTVSTIDVKSDATFLLLLPFNTDYMFSGKDFPTR